MTSSSEVAPILAATDSLKFLYIPVPETVTRLGLYVTGAGSDVVPPDSEYPRQSHPELYHFNWRTGRVLPEFQLVFISAGQGVFESRETGLLRVEAGTAMMLFPDVWHRYRPNPAVGWTEHWISFGGDLMFQWNQRGLFSADHPLTQVSDPASTLAGYQRVVRDIFNRDQAASLMVVHAMSIIADTVDQLNFTPRSPMPSKASAELDPVVLKAMEVIWNYSHQKVSVDMIAQQVQVTRRTLERYFRKNLGRTILQELVACRIQRARRLLRETHIPIKHVSYASGFSSLSNFCKVFRRETSMTPGEYRESAFKHVLDKSSDERAQRIPHV